MESLAAVMTVLFFVYVAALILLLDAEFAYAWSQPRGRPAHRSAPSSSGSSGVKAGVPAPTNCDHFCSTP